MSSPVINLRPNQAMLEKFESLRARVPAKIKVINDFIKDETVDLNKKMKKAGMPQIVLEKKIEFRE